MGLADQKAHFNKERDHTSVRSMSTQKLAAEALGTALLLISVVVSGIMAQALSSDLVGLALLANAIATGCMLYAIITVLGPISGAHFNPAVTLTFLLRREIDAPLAAQYILVPFWLSGKRTRCSICKSSRVQPRCIARAPLNGLLKSSPHLDCSLSSSVG